MHTAPYIGIFLPFTTEEGYLYSNRVRFQVSKCHSTVNISVCVRKAKLPGDLDLRMKGLEDGSRSHVSLVHFVVSVGKKNKDSGGSWQLFMEKSVM